MAPTLSLKVKMQAVKRVILIEIIRKQDLFYFTVGYNTY